MGEFATTKKDKNLLHGIGIKNVRKVVSDSTDKLIFPILMILFM